MLIFKMDKIRLVRLAMEYREDILDWDLITLFVPFTTFFSLFNPFMPITYTR